MKCPSCKNGKCQSAYLDELFPCKTCDSCGGSWILLEHYLRWKNAYTGEWEKPAVSEKIELVETKKAMICPVSGKLMLKYRISKDSEHRLDLSPSVNGIWMDKGEWEFLKESGLAGHLNTIFTDSWQKNIRSESSKETFKQVYQKKFGDHDYEKVKEIHDWLSTHPHRAALLAFLNAKNPWSAG